MLRRTLVVAFVVTALVAACAAPAASPGAPSSGASTPSIPASTSSPSRPNTPPPTPAATPSPIVTPEPPSPTGSPPAPPAPTTMVVRAYFLLRDPFSGGEVVNEPTLVPVLRTVPTSASKAAAAIRALLAGPSARERAAVPPIKTLIPAASKLLGIEISAGLATVDLSAEFASLSADDAPDLGMLRAPRSPRPGRVHPQPVPLGGSRQLRARGQAGQGVVRDGEPGRRFGRGHRPRQARHPGDVPRSLFVPRPLPALIFVDRPAWGAALLNPGRVTGLANVSEAQFRIALLDRKGKVLVDVPVRASCGTGCWGTFDVTLPYDVSGAQWGTLRVWDISEYSGRPVAVREEPVYLSPAP